MTGCEMRLGRDLIACVMGILIKAWVLPAAVPRFEAFALPCIVERATSSPTLMPYAYTPSMPYSLTKKHSTKGDATESHPVSFYRCCVLTMHGKLRSFEASKTKRDSKRPICPIYKSDHLLCLQNQQTIAIHAILFLFLSQKCQFWHINLFQIWHESVIYVVYRDNS